MNNRWLVLVSVVLAAFAYLAAILQFSDVINRDQFGSISVLRFYILGQELAQNNNILGLDDAMMPLSGDSRRMDLILPQNARIFINGMTGETNSINAGLYFFMTYFLFPRDIAVSMDQPARITQNGFIGRPPESDEELLTNGFDVVIDTVKADAAGIPNTKARSLHNFPQNAPVNPPWFRSRTDVLIAFLLPLLTALSGMSLLRFLLPSLNDRMPLAEKLACGLGLGMVAIAALTLGIKLCGFHGRGVILVSTTAAAIIEVWRRRKDFWAGFTGNFWKLIQNPVVMIGVLVLLLIFRMAALESITEYDAVAGWLLKAKIIHLCTGSEIVRWFSTPRLAHAHLDYPVLVPTLHAATFDSLGHVNEFVTKFWPAWMLLLLLVALGSLNRRWKGWISAPSFFLLALLLLPAIQVYARMEGGTFPMIFYTVMGFLQCAIWSVERDPARLGLGLILLFGAALSKFEGFILLALAGSWLLLLPSMRPALKPLLPLWRLPVFCFAAILPFLWLRVQIPVLHFESNWAAYALHHPDTTLFYSPRIFLILFSRWFVSSTFASWTGANGQLHWNGHWQGLSSLYNHPTLGLAWVCLLMTMALWFVAPARRQLVIWMLAVIVCTLAAFSVVFASFISITNLNVVLGYTSESTSGRYLLPILLAWAATSLTLLFADLASPAPIPGADPPPLSTPKPARQPAEGKKRPPGSGN